MKLQGFWYAMRSVCQPQPGFEMEEGQSWNSFQIENLTSLTILTATVQSLNRPWLLQDGPGIISHWNLFFAHCLCSLTPGFSYSRMCNCSSSGTSFKKSSHSKENIRTARFLEESLCAGIVAFLPCSTVTCLCLILVCRIHDIVQCHAASFNIKHLKTLNTTLCWSIHYISVISRHKSDHFMLQGLYHCHQTSKMDGIGFLSISSQGLSGCFYDRGSTRDSMVEYARCTASISMCHLPALHI